jgi:5-hydroxyisourate hydrolase-like protein (transthyretin family)
MKINLALAFFIAATVLSLPATVIASPGNIAGNITEASTGKPVAGAEVRVIENTGKSKGGAKVAEIRAVQDSDTAGRFLTGELTAGNYTIVVTHPEYKSNVQKDVSVTTAAAATVNVTLSAKSKY